MNGCTFLPLLWGRAAGFHRLLARGNVEPFGGNEGPGAVWNPAAEPQGSADHGQGCPAWMTGHPAPRSDSGTL